jgi:hypothetical protein
MEAVLSSQLPLRDSLDVLENAPDKWTPKQHKLIKERPNDILGLIEARLKLQQSDPKSSRDLLQDLQSVARRNATKGNANEFVEKHSSSEWGIRVGLLHPSTSVLNKDYSPKDRYTIVRTDISIAAEIPPSIVKHVEQYLRIYPLTKKKRATTRGYDRNHRKRRVSFTKAIQLSNCVQC